MTTVSDQELDLNVFKKNDKDNGCNESNNDHSNCLCIIRLLMAMKYYSLLNVIENKDHRETFIHFMVEVYHQCIDDYAHLLAIHGNQIQEINGTVIRDTKFGECDINKCSFTSRHQRRESNKNDNIKSDPKLNIYKEIMDSLHFYVYHLFHCGLRIEKMESDKVKTKTDDGLFDAEFARVSNRVSERKDITDPFGRFQTETNGKFTITTDQSDMKTDEGTYLDALCEHLLSKGFDQTTIRDLVQFVKEQEFDSDSVVFDVKNDATKIGNIAIRNVTIFDASQHFIQLTQVTSSSFNIGFRFYYWSAYKSPPKDQSAKPIKIENINDHSGYDVHELYVEPKYGSFKEEFSHYSHFTMEQYEEVAEKINMYLKTNRVKATRSNSLYNSPNDYGVEYDAKLGFDNLLAVLLYTDFTKLSADFTSTFRKKSSYESLEKVKKRNSKYWFWSKTLRETVEIFGEYRGVDGAGTAYTEHKYALKGPFYTGMSVVMSIPAFNMRLCSPTSTSVQIAVAIKFSGPDGMIIALDNPRTLQYAYLKGFNCSYISRFKEEDERLFFGGFHPIQIVSVRLRGSKKVYGSRLRPLKYLDIMMNGGRGGGGGYKSGVNPYDAFGGWRVTKKDIALVKVLIDNAAGVTTQMKLDPYLVDTFEAFTLNKKQLVMDFEGLDDNIKEMRDLLIHKLVQYRHDKNHPKDWMRECDNFNNLPQQQILKVFKELKNMVIMTTNRRIDGHDVAWDAYPLSVVNLLSIIDGTVISTVTVKAITRERYQSTSDYSDEMNGRYNYENGGTFVDEYGPYNWIQALWEKSSDKLKSLYEQKNYGIELCHGKIDDYDGCWLEIKKK